MPTLEHLIKQEKFRSEKHKAIISVIYAANLVNSHYEEIFKRFGISVQQFNALRILRGQYPGPCSIVTIRERMLDKMSDASRIVERLRKNGLAERVASKRDRRAAEVVITKKGLGLLAQVDKLDAEMNLPTQKISDDEAAALNEILEKVINALVL